MEATMSETQMAYGLVDDDDRIDPSKFEGLLVKFVMHPKHDLEKSKAAGRPIYEEVLYVDIRAPGDRSNRQFRPAATVDTRRWPKHYQAFLDKGNVEYREGTPLEEWPAISGSLREELKFFNVFTVEQLADLSDTAKQSMMGIQDWVMRAKAFLEVSGKAAEANELAEALEKRDNDIALLTEQVNALLSRAEKAEAKIAALEED